MDAGLTPLDGYASVQIERGHRGRHANTTARRSHHSS